MLTNAISTIFEYSLSIATTHSIQFKKWIVLLLYPLFCSTSLFAQNTYVKSNPFPTDYFIQNKGQWNHEDSSIGFILWNGIHNVHLFKNKPGFTWKFTPVKLHKEGHENEISGIESESEKERERERALEAGNAKESSASKPRYLTAPGTNIGSS